MYQKIAPMFLVANVDEAMTWYSDVLGAKLQHSLPDNPPFEWVSLLLDNTEIMIGQKQEAQKWYIDSVTISDTPSNIISYIYVDNAADLHERVKSRVRVIMEPVDQSYGIREFAVADPFGFILVFARILD